MYLAGTVSWWRSSPKSQPEVWFKGLSKQVSRHFFSVLTGSFNSLYLVCVIWTGHEKKQPRERVLRRHGKPSASASWRSVSKTDTLLITLTHFRWRKRITIISNWWSVFILLHQSMCRKIGLTHCLLGGDWDSGEWKSYPVHRSEAETGWWEAGRCIRAGQT